MNAVLQDLYSWTPLLNAGYFSACRDKIWESVSGETKEAIGMKKRADGEFWMSYGDFCQHFQEITICTLGPDFDGDGLADKTGRILFVP